MNRNLGQPVRYVCLIFRIIKHVCQCAIARLQRYGGAARRITEGQPLGPPGDSQRVGSARPAPNRTRAPPLRYPVSHGVIRHWGACARHYQEADMVQAALHSGVAHAGSPVWASVSSDTYAAAVHSAGKRESSCHTPYFPASAHLRVGVCYGDAYFPQKQCFGKLFS